MGEVVATYDLDQHLIDHEILGIHAGSASGITGTGTATRLAVWTGTNTLGDSLATDDATSWEVRAATGTFSGASRAGGGARFYGGADGTDMIPNPGVTLAGGVHLFSGASSAASGLDAGHIWISSADGDGGGGRLVITTGVATGTGGDGGDIFIAGGSGVGAFGHGANFIAQAGDGVGPSDGGQFGFTAGGGGDTGNGGPLGIVAGTGGATSGNGGLINIESGSAPAIGSGGSYTMSAGSGGATSGDGGGFTATAGSAQGIGQGGSLGFRAGEGGPSSASPLDSNGGGVFIGAGSANSGDNNGGRVQLQTGLASGSGIAGQLWFIQQGSSIGVFQTMIVDQSNFSADRTVTFPDADLDFQGASTQSFTFLTDLIGGTNTLNFQNGVLASWS